MRIQRIDHANRGRPAKEQSVHGDRGIIQILKGFTRFWNEFLNTILNNPTGQTAPSIWPGRRISRRRPLCTNPTRRCRWRFLEMRAKRGGGRWRHLNCPRAGMQSMAPHRLWPSQGMRRRKRADDLERRFPEDTFVRFTICPRFGHYSRCAVAGLPWQSSFLKTASPYDLAQSGTWFGFFGNLYPALCARRSLPGRESGGRCRRRVPEDSRSPQHHFRRPRRGRSALIGSAFAASGDRVRARNAHQNFLTTWKDADRDIPIPKLANEEYAKL